MRPSQRASASPLPHAAAGPRLSRLDRSLPLWILLAMAAGVALGRSVPDLARTLDAVRLGDVSLPIALGLLWMMYPVLANRSSPTGSACPAVRSTCRWR